MGRHTNGGALLLCAVLCVRIAGALQVTQLPQGLLQKKTDIKVTAEQWKVIITVEDGSTQWDSIMQVVDRLMDLNLPLIDAWSGAQLVQLRHRINHLSRSHHRRSKRGLIDGVGWLAHSLFGLATDEEVTELRTKIEDNRRWQQSLSTWAEDFVIVINRTREDLALNRVLLNNITTRTLKAIDQIHLIMTLQDQVHQLELIERRTNDIIDDLEHGQLTELILPRDTLTSIVGDSLTLEWYYRWCTIKPLWNDGWAFETQLPVVSKDPIIGYELIAFPVWGPGNHTVKLDIARFAALDTRSGRVSEPRSCRGTDPQVCSHGPISQQGCAAAVITQQAVAAACHVLVVEEEKRAFSLLENEVVVVLGRTTLIAQVCPNSELPQRATLARGTHRIQWKPGCRLETKDFSITAALMPVGHRTVKGWHIPHGAINLIDYFTNRTYPSALPPLIPLNIDLLPVPPAIHWTSHLNVKSIVILVAIFITSSLLAVLLWKFLKEPQPSASAEEPPPCARSDDREHCARSDDREHNSLHSNQENNDSNPDTAATLTVVPLGPYSFKE